MTLFCFLWIPLFYVFWRSLYDESMLEGGTWALVLGTIVAFFRFFMGAFVDPGGFGQSRWISACIDIIALPAAIPFIVCLILAVFRIISLQSNFTNYAFLWLIPVAGIRALSWSSQSNPFLLMGVPVLWTTVIVGVGFFIRIVQNGWRWAAIPAILGAIALPIVAATAYWALFSQRSFIGIGLLSVCFVPMIFSIVMSFRKVRN